MALGARSEFTEDTKIRTYTEQNGLCAHCKTFTARSKGRFDHTIPDAIGGDNSRENCKFLCLACDSIKTNGTGAVPLSGDKPIIAKMKREVVKTNAHYDRLRMKAPGERLPLRGTIPGRGFEKGSKPMAKKELPEKLRQPVAPLPPPPMYRDMTPEELAAEIKRETRAHKPNADKAQRGGAK